MDFKKKASLIIYRFRERGLEVFLVNDAEEKDGKWAIPNRDSGNQKRDLLIDQDRLIELDPVEQDDGAYDEGWAVEGDWHEIPSLKAMLYEDALQLKEKLTEMEKGAFFKIKEAFKQVLPHQYKMLKELKEILTDRNSVKDI